MKDKLVYEFKSKIDMRTLNITELDYSKYFFLEGKIKTGESEKIQVLGSSFKKLGDDSLDEESVDRFLKKCKQIVESDIFEGCVTHPFVLSLVNFDTKLKRMVYDDGSIAITTPFSREDKRITEKKYIEFRRMLCFQFYTPLSKDELNKKFGDYFYKEGETAKTNI